MARDGRTAHARQTVETGRDPKVEFARRLAREPQIAALEAVAAWAEQQGVSAASVRGMREVIAVFAADPKLPKSRPGHARAATPDRARVPRYGPASL